LEHAIARVERGESQGVVVAYLSRFGRSLAHGLRAIERITDAGGRFVSVQEGEALDFSTDTGRLVLRMFFSIVEWELDRTRAQWAAAVERAIRRGVYLGGSRPFGYLRTASGRLAVHPREGPIVTEMFRRRAEGASLADIRAFLRGTGIRGVHGANWDLSVVHGMMHSGVHLGQVRYGEWVNDSAHPPLVDRDTWDRAHVSDHQLPRRVGREPALLRGLLRCAGCQRLLATATKHKDTSHGRRIYYCGSINGAGKCAAPAQVWDSLVEPYVELLFWRELALSRIAPAQRELARLRSELARRERELNLYRDNPGIPTAIGGERFAQGLAVRARRADLAGLALARATAAGGEQVNLPSSGELRDKWQTMSLTERRETISQVISCAFVTKGAGGIRNRLHAYRHGRGPTYPLPWHEQPTRTLEPFDPSTCGPAAHLRQRPAEWSEKRIESVLRAFLNGRDRWPSFMDFQAAGLALLHDQIERHGGCGTWAAEFQCPLVKAPYLRDGEWTDATIRKALGSYLADRTTWPTWDEFRADGHYALRHSINAAGGSERWAREFGIALPVGQRTAKNWTYSRIRLELTEFTQGRRDWPTKSEFEAGDRKPLYNAIGHRNLRARLARDIGLKLPKGRTTIRRPVPRRWNNVAITAALDAVLAGRDTWPTAREMKEAGLGGLDQRLIRQRTHVHWARRYGVRPRLRQHR
jgi:Resolvase, N terminal domain/Recombinase